MSFSEVISEILKMRIRDFIESFHDLMPRHRVVKENESVRDLYKHIEEGIEFFVVLSDEGRVTGVVKALDVVYALGRKKGRAFVPFATIASSLRRVKHTIETIDSMVVRDVMNVTPPIISENETIEELVELLENEGEDYAVIVEDELKFKGLITDRTLLEAARKIMTSKKKR